MSEHIKIKSNGSDEESAEFDKFFPSFIWAVRGFTLDPVIDGKTVTEDEYLEQTLQMKSVLGGLARCDVDAIRNGAISCIQSAAESTAKLENERAIKESVALYEKRFRETVKFPTETVLEVSNCNHVCEKEAAEYFMNLAIFDAEKSYYQRMMEELAASYESFVKENETSSQEACKMLLCSLHKPIEDDFETGKYACSGGYEVYRRNIDSLIRKYREAPRKGIMSEEALYEFMKQQEPTSAAVLKADEKLTEEAKKNEAPLNKKPTEVKLPETPRWRHFPESKYIMFIMFLPIARCGLVETPLNAAVMVGSDPVEFKCKSDQGIRLKWYTQQSQSKLILFNGHSISKEAESFCSVENEAHGEFYLKLTAIREAAQTYICQETGTYQESSADVIIIEREAQCKIDANNSHVIMKCDLEFRGNWAPELEWRYKGRLITERVNAAIVSNKTVSSTLTVPVSANDRKYTCTTRFDIRGKPQWTSSDNIPDYESYSVLTVKANQAIAESATEILVSPGQEVNVRCLQAKPGDRVSWMAEDKSGRKFDIYDGYMLHQSLSRYTIDSSSGVCCSLAFVATKETAISYTCTILGRTLVKERTIINLSDKDEEQFSPSGIAVSYVIVIAVLPTIIGLVGIIVIFYRFLRVRKEGRRNEKAAADVGEPLTHSLSNTTVTNDTKLKTNGAT